LNCHNILYNKVLTAKYAPLDEIPNTNSYVRKNNLFMQNKPKLRKSQMNVNKVLTKSYEKKTLSERGKNKPKTNPNKAKSKPNKPKTKPNQIEDPEGNQFQSNQNPQNYNRQKISCFFEFCCILAHIVIYCCILLRICLCN